jgi:hypothetical protein
VNPAPILCGNFAAAPKVELFQQIWRYIRLVASITTEIGSALFEIVGPRMRS